MQPNDSDADGYVGYQAVLQLALRFMYGNKAIQDTDFETFKFVRELETKIVAEKVVKDSQMSKKWVSSASIALNRIKYNLVPHSINMRIALMVWKE